MLSVPYLEMDITSLCNLRCPGCTHYSNYKLNSTVDIETGVSWLEEWSGRVTPEEFYLLGGEPLIHKDVNAYVETVTRLWPNARRHVVSNGLLFERNRDFFRVLAETGTKLLISIHSHRDVRYLDRLIKSLEVMKQEAERHQFQVEFRREQISRMFYTFYQGEGADMRPFEDGDPKRSWEVCGNKLCKTIHQGRLWKCPPIAFLGLVAERFDLDKVDAWKPYLSYQGIGPDASDEEIMSLYREKEAPICSMCPVKLTTHENAIVT